MPEKPDEQIPRMELKPFKTEVSGTSTPPPGFQEGGKEHRKSVLASSALIVVLALASEVKPQLLGVSVPTAVLWFGLFVGHLYFFAMWRITAPMESDQENKFWNLAGLVRQALIRGTGGFPGKRIGQYILIRALPIWAFVVGLVILFWKAYIAIRFGTHLL